MLSVVNLGLYWKTTDESLLNLYKTDTEISFNMQKQIIKGQIEDYLITPSKFYVVNIIAKVVHNSDLTQQEEPSYIITINLQEIITKYSQKQFHDTVKLVEYFANFNKFVVKS